MGSVEDIVKTIDAYLLKSGKEYLTLAQSNQLLNASSLLTVKEQATQDFKKLLENNLLPHAFKTETLPRQWRIPLSPKGEKKLQANLKKKKLEKISKTIAFLVEGPSCKSSGEAGTHCKNCGQFILNPVRTQKVSKNKKQYSIKSQKDPIIVSNSNSNETQLTVVQKKGLYRLIAFVILAIVLYFSFNNSESSSPTLSYISHDTYGAKSKDSFDELFELIQNNDQQGIVTLMLSGNIEVFNSGTEVYNVGFGYGYVVVKLKDSPTRYWVVSQAVSDQ